MMQSVTILGATGSIGTSTLDVLARHPGRYRLHALTGHSRIELLAELCARFRPERAVVPDADAAKRLRELLSPGAHGPAIDHGTEALCEVAGAADIVMAAIVGAAGLPAACAAARAGRRILLANKEALVMAGPLFMQLVKRHGAILLPIDSEHNAVFQCYPQGSRRDDPANGVRRIILTASGGPFRSWSAERFDGITPEQACAHPNWVMGRKISVDSATMMNKGLEVIEAHWLFGLPPECIEVVIHPQSVVHSLVSYVDGSVIAQMGNPDMRTPIAHALAWPDRIEAGVEPLDLARIGRLDFEKPDPVRFPCIDLAYAALREGGTAPAILNAANEMAVEAFLNRAIPFPAIASTVHATLSQVPSSIPRDLDDVLEADRAARAAAGNLLSRTFQTA